jgi:hypothetical protein
MEFVMKRQSPLQITLLLIVLLLSSPLFAWVHSGNLTISSKSQMNALAPGLTEVTGIFRIETDDLTDLDSLATLERVGNSLEICNNPALTSVDGLSSLRYIGNDFDIVNNDALTKIPTFPSLTTVADKIEFNYNDALIEIEGQQLLTHLGDDLEILGNKNLKSVTEFPLLTAFHYCLQINDNPALESLDIFSEITLVTQHIQIMRNASLKKIAGFDKLKTITGYLQIIDNSSLTTIEGFPVLSLVNIDFEIIGNPELQTINAFGALKTVTRDFEVYGNNNIKLLESFSSLEWIGRNVTIYDNAKLLSFCGLHTMAIGASSPVWSVYANAYNPSRQDVIDDGPICPIPAQISGKVFYDKDGNGLCDADEKGLAHVAVRFNSEGTEKSTKLLTDSEGLYRLEFYGPIGDYRLTIDENTLPDGFSYTTPAIIENTIQGTVDYEFKSGDFGFNFADSSVIDEHNNADLAADDAQLTFIEGSPSFIKEPWSRAVDGKVNGWDGTATVGQDENGQVWAVFEIIGGPVIFDKLSIIVDNGQEDNAYEFRHMQEFDLYASATGVESGMFNKVGTFTLGTDWITICRFGQSVSAKYIKLVINKPNFGADEWRQIVEITIGEMKHFVTKKGIDSGELVVKPASYTLCQNYPNPFNPTTSIAYTLPGAQNVDIAVYNIRGDLVKQLASGRQDAGLYNISWDATNAAGNKVTTGVYFYRINAGSFTDTKKMTLIQ